MFLAFEGLDGAGKSTLIRGVQAELEAQKKGYVVTREPGGTPLGDELRQILLRTTGDTPVPRAEALIYQAIRAQHVDKLIKPTLQKKQWVLCDRFAASSVAFQAGARKVLAEAVHRLNEFSVDGTVPDLYVLIDLSVEESLRRLSHRGEKQDRFEREAKAFHQSVRDAYLQMVQKDVESGERRWFVLDGEEPPGQVVQKLTAELKRRKWLD